MASRALLKFGLVALHDQESTSQSWQRISCIQIRTNKISVSPILPNIRIFLGTLTQFSFGMLFCIFLNLIGRSVSIFGAVQLGSWRFRMARIVRLRVHCWLAHRDVPLLQPHFSSPSNVALFNYRRSRVST
jgi:hypothetical protein